MKIKILIVLMPLFIITSIFFYCVTRQQNHIILPFKCIFSTNYIFKKNEKIQIMHVTQDLRIYDEKSGYFLINGDAVIDNVTYQIRRSILLNDIREKEGKTIQATIVKIFPMKNDSIPDALFDTLLQEYQISNDSLQVDFFHLHFRTWLVGGPYSFISVCERY